MLPDQTYLQGGSPTYYPLLAMNTFFSVRSISIPPAVDNFWIRCWSLDRVWLDYVTRCEVSKSRRVESRPRDVCADRYFRTTVCRRPSNNGRNNGRINEDENGHRRTRVEQALSTRQHYPSCENSPAVSRNGSRRDVCNDRLSKPSRKKTFKSLSYWLTRTSVWVTSLVNRLRPVTYCSRVYARWSSNCNASANAVNDKNRKSSRRSKPEQNHWIVSLVV